MRYVNEGVIRDRLAALPGDEPRVVVAGNFATPFELVRILDGALPRCRVFSLNMQIGWPCRDGFITETIGIEDVPSAFAKIEAGTVLRSVVVM